jgi:hypothetical protein
MDLQQRVPQAMRELVSFVALKSSQTNKVSYHLTRKLLNYAGDVLSRQSGPEPIHPFSLTLLDSTAFILLTRNEILATSGGRRRVLHLRWASLGNRNSNPDSASGLVQHSSNIKHKAKTVDRVPDKQFANKPESKHSDRNDGYAVAVLLCSSARIFLKCFAPNQHDN